MSFISRIRERFSGRAKLSATTLSPVTTPTTRALEKLRTFFETSFSRNQLYIRMVDLDDELQSAISTSAMVIDRCMKGYKLAVGTEISPEEKELLTELKNFDKIIHPYVYDIAYKVIRDGDACYVCKPLKNIGVSSLTWLPIDQLTILEDSQQILDMSKTIQEKNLYVLNENQLVGRRQEIVSKDVTHFNWGRQEIIYDKYHRKTLGIYNDPPLEALSSKIIWKFAVLINDMLMREVLVPREHHQLPAESFNPKLFRGASYEEQFANAQKAAQAATDDYVRSLEGRRVDRGYATLDNVKINIVEPRLTYTSPNDLLSQLRDAIYGSIGTPESAVSGRSRATYASEVAIETYLLLKAEFLAGKIGEKLVELVKRHLDTKTNKKFEKYYTNITYDVQLIFLPREVARTISILRETGIFTKTELRKLFGLDPLTSDQLGDLAEPIGYKHTESPAETVSSARRKTGVTAPTTPESSGQQQIS